MAPVALARRSLGRAARPAACSCRPRASTTSPGTRSRSASPNRPWRRWGSDRLRPDAAPGARRVRGRSSRGGRVGIGDLSRPDGGVFDERFGGRGHASHQNGLDVDVYYPRLDGQELRRRPAGSGRARAFAGPRDSVRARRSREGVRRARGSGFGGPRRKVEPLIYHDDHMHVRIGPDPKRRVRIGRSVARPAHRTPLRVGDTTSSHARRSWSAASTATSAPGPRSRASLAALVPGGRPLGRLAAQSGRLRARPAPERARRRPEPQLPVGVEGGRPAVGSRVPRAAPALRAGDAGPPPG